MVDELEAKRLREVYKGDNLYVILSWRDGELYDLQCSISGKIINHDQNTLSNLDALARMTSLALREFEPEYVAANLLQCARGPQTLPSILANAILEHGVWINQI
jgi:hypothetical protein